MSSLTTLLVVYILGGLTLLPAIAALLFLHAYLTFPEVFHDQREPPLRRDGDDDVFKTEDEKLVRRLANSVDVAAGYFLVTREFVPGGANGKPIERMSPAGNTVQQNNSPSVYQSVYRSLFDRKSNIGATDVGSSAKPRGRRQLNEFFVVLRHGHLMLYDDEQQAEVRHVISLSMYTVSIYGGAAVIPEGELYIRRNAICLSRRAVAVDATMDENTALPFFFFSDNCSNKEDFYLALVKHQEKIPEDPTIPPKPLRYCQKDIISLVQRLHSSEDHLQMNWVNGLLGRVFLAVYKTPEMEEFFRNRIVKKISRVTKPNFLSDIQIQKIHIGDAVPYITNPRLKEMTADGDFCVEAAITYSGNFRLEIATKATMSLGARFKPREVNLLLSIVLKRLEGHGLIRIKPPPSNRLWFSFERMPKIELSIEPIVGSRQVAWGPILRIIESRIREVIQETVVLPYYDDIPFTDTINQTFRGGIWQTLIKRSQEVSAELSKEIDEVILAVAKDAEINEGPNNAPSALGIQSLSGTATLSSLEDEKEKYATGNTETEDSLRVDIGTASIGPQCSHKRRSKAVRNRAPDSITPTPLAPLISTDAVNVTAVRESPESMDKNKNASSAISSFRSRSSSNPQISGTMLNCESAGHHTADNTESSLEASDVIESNDGQSFRPTSNQLITMNSDSKIPASAKSSSSMLSQSLGSNFTSHHLLGTGSRTPSISMNVVEKPSMTAIGTATAAVKKWYTNSRKGSTPSESSLSPQRPRNLPPSEIPDPPPSRKTSPMNVPARKNLPPPVIPVRKNRRASAPPIPPPEGSSGGEEGSQGELLVVAAPEFSEATSSSEDEDKQIDFGGMGVSMDSASLSSRRRRLGEGGSETGRRTTRDRIIDEAELWHPAEEAEMRTRVPWEPDEL